MGNTRLASGDWAAPTKGKQIEAGLRWQPDGENLTLNAAVHQIKQTNVLTPNLTTTGSTSVQAGEVRSQGVELSAVGKLTPELSIVGAYVFQNVKNTKANDETQASGRWTFRVRARWPSLWADWTGARARWKASAGRGRALPELGGGASDNSLKVPSYTVYDAGLHHEMPNWRFALNASNLFDRKYVSGCQSYSVCMYGNGRTVMATANY